MSGLFAEGLMSSSTQQNWRALQRLAADLFAQLHVQHPSWCLEEAVAHLKLPRTALLIELLSNAGFPPRREPTPAETLAVDSALLHGVWSERVIAAETGIDVHRVRTIVQMRRGGYGSTPYGKEAYGGNRQTSDGSKAVPRRVTVTGQMSYRGRVYTLGAVYRGRQARVLERGQQLLVLLDRKSVV
jgi:hypothetical protein